MKTYEPIFLPGGLRRLLTFAVCFAAAFIIFYGITRG